LAATPKYILRFKLPVEAYDENTVRLNSPGFLLLRPLGTSKTTSPSHSAPPPASGQSTGTIDVGAKVAIALGAVIGVLAVSGIGAFMLLRRKVNKVDNVVAQIPQYILEKDVAGPRHELGELKQSFLHELPSNDRPAELADTGANSQQKVKEVEVQETNK
jgi:hypothetical protein